MRCQQLIVQCLDRTFAAGRGLRWMIRQGDLQPRQLVLAVLAAGVGVIENLH